MNITDKLAKESSREYAYRMMKQNIISLELAPGSWISENEIAAELAVSRTPVREALIELSKSKLVEIIPQKGSRVSLIDYDIVEELSFLRRVLETAIVECACDMKDELDLSEVKSNLLLQHFYEEHPAPDRLLELDNEFHRQLFVMCNKSNTYQLMVSMMAHFDRVRCIRLNSNADTHVVSDHEDIVAAIEAHDKEKAKAIVTEHLSRYKFDKDEMKEKYPEYIK